MLSLTLNKFDPEPASALCALFDQRMTMTFGAKAGFSVKLRKNENTLRLAAKIVEEYGKLVNKP